MKRYLKFFMVIALGVLTMACAKEPAEEQTQILDEPITINFTIGLPEADEAVSRASFSDELGITWEAGDQIWYTGNDAGVNIATLAAGDITENGHKASFSVTTSNASGVLRYNWSTRNTAEWDFGSLQTNFVNQSNFDSSDASLTANTTLEFTQSEAGVMNKRFLFLHSATSNQTFTVNEGAVAAADVNMEIVGSIFRILPYTTAYNSEEVQYVSFELNGSSNLGGVAIYNYNDGTYSLNTTWNYYYKKVIVNLDTPFALTEAVSKQTSKGIYFASPRTSAAIEGGYTIKVKTDQATYTYTSAKDLSVSDNKVRNFPILLDAEHRLADDAVIGDLSYAQVTGLAAAYEHDYLPGTQGTSWVAASIRLTGEVDWTTAEHNAAGHVNDAYYDGISFSVIDNATGDPADWCSVVVRDNDTWWDYTVTQNTSTSSRSATVTATLPALVNKYKLLDGEGTKVFTITQTGAPAGVAFSYDVTANPGSYTNAGGTFTNYTGRLVSLTNDGAILIAGAAAQPAFDGEKLSVVAEDSWLTPSFQNTTNYMLLFTIAPNTTDAARSTRVYLEYDGTRSGNYYTVTQEAGPYYVVTPTLTKIYNTEISEDGETITAAATLELDINGTPSADVQADVATYGVTLTCGTATATVTNAAGNVQIVFPANATASTKNYTLTATGASSSSISFTQAAGSGGGGAPTYNYTITKNNGNGSGVIWGMGTNATNSNDFTITDASLSGSSVDLTDSDVQSAIIAQAFSIEEPQSGEMPDGYNGYSYDADALTIVVTGTPTSTRLELGVHSWATNQYRAKISWIEDDGTVAGHWFVFIP